MSETPDLIARLRKGIDGSCERFVKMPKNEDFCRECGMREWRHVYAEAAAEIDRLTTALTTAERERDEARSLSFDSVHRAQIRATEARIWREAAEIAYMCDMKLHAAFTQRATQAETETPKPVDPRTTLNIIQKGG